MNIFVCNQESGKEVAGRGRDDYLLMGSICQDLDRGRPIEAKVEGNILFLY